MTIKYEFLLLLSIVVTLSMSTSVSAENLSPSQVFVEYVQKRNADPARLFVEYLAKPAKTKAEKASNSLGTTRIENMKVLAENINGDHATVSVSGTVKDSFSAAINAASTALGAPPSKTSEGTIFLVRENGAWRIEQENWLTEMGNKKRLAPTAPSAAQKLGSYEWCWQASAAAFPQTPLAGNVSGIAFKPTQISLEHGLRDRLMIQKGDLFEGTSIEIILGEPLSTQSNKKYIVGRNADSFNSPDINFRASTGTGPPDMHSFTAADNYGMRLEFGQQKGDLLPGYIVLRLPYKQSCVQGYFYAKLKNIPHN